MSTVLISFDGGRNSFNDTKMISAMQKCCVSIKKNGVFSDEKKEIFKLCVQYMETYEDVIPELTKSNYESLYRKLKFLM